MPAGVNAIPGRTSSGKRRTLKLLVIVAALVLVAVGIVLNVGQGVGEVRLGDGGVVRLERYEFRSDTVRYHQAKIPMAQALWNALPKKAKKRFVRFRPGVTAFVGPSFPNEPQLSAAFSARDASGKPQDAGTRLVVLDDRGQSFDAVLNSAGNAGVFEAAAFPRRGRQLALRLMDGDKAMADFKIPNPCPGPHHVWKANAMPASVTNGALEVSLEKFTADVARQRTRCTFRVRESGADTSAYLLVQFEIADATGNHWRPGFERPVQTTNGSITVALFGALWPEEEAWKLRVEFKPADKHSEDQSAQVAEFLAKPDQLTGDSR